MALIKCPECGKEVSSQAVACPVCGFPIAKANPKGTVAIRITEQLAVKIRITNVATGKLICQASPGEVARFEVDGPTTISLCGPLSSSDNPKYHHKVEAGGRYEYKCVQSFFSAEFKLIRVDVIDSD